jgi:hypothetical protein
VQLMQQFPVGRAKDTEKTVGGVRDRQQKETATICTAWEYLRPRDAGHGEVRGLGAGQRGGAGRRGPGPRDVEHRE